MPIYIIWAYHDTNDTVEGFPQDIGMGSRMGYNYTTFISGKIAMPSFHNTSDTKRNNFGKKVNVQVYIFRIDVSNSSAHVMRIRLVNQILILRIDTELKIYTAKHMKFRFPSVKNNF